MAINSSVDRTPTDRSTSQRDEATDERPVGDVGGEADERSLGPVVEHQEAGRLEQSDRRGCRRPAAHPRMDEREQGVHERGPGEQAMHQAEDRSEPPSAASDRKEHDVVDQRKRQPDQEMKDVPERLGARPVARKGGTEQEGEVDARQVQLVPRPQRGGENQRSREPASDSTPEAHAAIASVTASAALTSARWVRPCGRFPRKSPVAGSISSAYSPTSLASPMSSSISSTASLTRPQRASASASQNEQVRNAPSDPASPSSPL